MMKRSIALLLTIVLLLSLCACGETKPAAVTELKKGVYEVTDEDDEVVAYFHVSKKLTVTDPDGLILMEDAKLKYDSEDAVFTVEGKTSFTISQDKKAGMTMTVEKKDTCGLSKGDYHLELIDEDDAPEPVAPVTLYELLEDSGFVVSMTVPQQVEEEFLAKYRYEGQPDDQFDIDIDLPQLDGYIQWYGATGWSDYTMEEVAAEDEMEVYKSVYDYFTEPYDSNYNTGIITINGIDWAVWGGCIESPGNPAVKGMHFELGTIINHTLVELSVFIATSDYDHTGKGMDMLYEQVLACLDTVTVTYN